MIGRFRNAMSQGWSARGVLRRVRSVRGKLMRIVVLTTAIALLAAGIAMLTHDLSAYRESWMTDLDTQASILATSTGPALEFNDHRAAARILAALQVRPTVLVAALYAANGTLYSGYVRTGQAPPPQHLHSTERWSNVSGSTVELIQPIVQNGEHQGAIYLRAHHDILGRVNAYLGIFTLVTLMSMLVALALSTALQKVITEPLDAMASVARQVVNRRDYSLRANKTTNDEIGVVVDAFNSMLDEVQSRARALEQSNVTLKKEVQI
ncbi:MAG: CHASE sensor domain-containing protein, partial [Steroidobacteraceae bacterium]